MKKKYALPVKMLGQSGCKMSFPCATVYLDPYLSNSVQILDAPDLERLVPIAVSPEKVSDADIVLITHAHIDHCDPYTLPLLAQASPQARFVGPKIVVQKLLEWGINQNRVFLALEDWIELAPGLRILAIPAAHPEIQRDDLGNLSCIGYLIDYEGQFIYHAGDTFVRQEIIDILIEQGPVHTAFLPVNEHNFFRERRGIVGNMTVREAFQFAQEIGAKQVVPVHWDMFANNTVYPDEIRLLHKSINPNFSLLIRPCYLSLKDVQISIVIRTLNEALHLESLLTSIAGQRTEGLKTEVVLVDSGSTDGTLEIAQRYGCRIIHITRSNFSFGRALNMGCAAAIGDILVIISGHCVPKDEHWLRLLCQPILESKASYTYGRQVAGPKNHFSESRIFAKYFPEQSRIPQDDFFCNNANSALLHSAWKQFPFDEDLTGLEDMELAQRIVHSGLQVGYVAEAVVFHHHNESWSQVRHRFERESIALQKIMPHVHINLFDTLRYITTSILNDWVCSFRVKSNSCSLFGIAAYRCNQFIGSWKGNHQHRKLSHIEKEKYFYPN
jgi:rhamnosyltransferase